MEKIKLFIKLFIIFGSNLMTQINATKLYHETEKCSTVDCIHAAARIIEKLNNQIDPCDDFYEYACGNFLNEVHTPDERSTVNTLSLMNDKLLVKLKHGEYLLTVLSKPISHCDPQVERISKTVYKSCLNIQNIDDRGQQPLLELIKKIGGWPTLDGDKWNEKAWDWEKALLGVREYATKRRNNIFKNEINELLNENDVWIYLEDERDQMLKGEDKLSENQLVLLFKSYIIDVVKELLHRKLLEKEEARIIKETKEMIEFEFKLRDYLNYFKMYSSIKVKSIGNKTEIRQSQNLYRYTLWLNLFSPFPLSTLNNTFIDPIEPESLKIKFLNFLTKETSKRTRANYVAWRVVQHSLTYLSENLRGPAADFNKFAFGKEDIEQRWIECVLTVAENAPVSTGVLYINEYFRQEHKIEAEKLVNYILDEYLDMISRVEWMDNYLKMDAITKAKAMLKYIGYHEKLTDLETTNNYYRGFKIPENKYFEQMMGLRVFHTDRDFENLQKRDNYNDWAKLAIPVTTNAFYSRKDNSIQFPAAILQSPYFSASQPNYLNYGGIGSVIGHEITHSFNNFALNRQNWSKESNYMYEQNLECLINQFSKFRAKEVEELLGDEKPFYLNGRRTIREDIADNGGVILAYNAYRKWVHENGEEMSLIGVSHNPYQLFWLAFAQSYCSVERALQMKHKIETDEHSLDKFRVLGTITNMEDFSKDFNCKLNSPMNPEKKCTVW